KKDYPAAFALARSLGETYKDDPGTLDELAWLMVDPELPIRDPDLGLAEKLALRANDITKGGEASILDTLARIYAAKGDFGQAVAYQSQAVEKADDDQSRTQFRKTLADYKARGEMMNDE